VFSAVFGFITSIAIIIYACLSTSSNHAIYFDRLGILIVLGGTFSAAAITFTFSQLKQLFRSMVRVFTREQYEARSIVRELVTHAKKLQNRPEQISTLVAQVRDRGHPFIYDGLRLLENDFDHKTVERIMISSINERRNAHLAHVDMMRALAKYPPAFGMIGTVIGLVSLLQGISAEGGIDRIGPSMAVALITTLYGLLISNFIFVPMSENIFNKTKRDTQIRRIIMEAVLLIRQKEDAMAIQEYLNSFLHPNNREDVLKISTSPTQEQAA
jgi:chemotaxis protein MotA